MARVYTHNVETDKKILELNGLLDKEKDETGKFKNIICPRCGTNNPYGNAVCKKCNLGLDVKSIVKMEKDAKSVGFDLLELLKDKSILTKIVSNKSFLIINLVFSLNIFFYYFTLFMIIISKTQSDY